MVDLVSVKHSCAIQCMRQIACGLILSSVGVDSCIDCGCSVTDGFQHWWFACSFLDSVLSGYGICIGIGKDWIFSLHPCYVYDASAIYNIPAYLNIGNDLLICCVLLMP